MFCRWSRRLPILVCNYCRIWRSSSFNRTYHSSYHVMLQSNLLLYFGLSIWVVLFSLFSCVPRTANSLNRIYQPLCDTIFYCKTYCHAHITFISFDSGNAIKWIQLLDCSQTLAQLSCVLVIIMFLNTRPTVWVLDIVLSTIVFPSQNAMTESQIHFSFVIFIIIVIIICFYVAIELNLVALRAHSRNDRVTRFPWNSIRKEWWCGRPYKWYHHHIENP